MPQVAWITGASSGIGRALAVELARSGYNLVLSGRKAEELDATATVCKSSGNPDISIMVLPFDVRDFDRIPALAKEVVDQFGRIDLLINNAGISQRGLTAETDFSVDKTIMEINYLAPVALTKAVLPQMLHQGSGQIVAISSVVGYFGYYMRSAYSASKHAIHGFMDSIWAEYADKGIRTLIVAPGGVRTNISLNALDANGSTHGKNDNLQTKGFSPEEVAVKVTKALKNNKRELVIAKNENVLVFLRRHIPALYFKLIPKIRR